MVLNFYSCFRLIAACIFLTACAASAPAARNISHGVDGKAIQWHWLHTQMNDDTLITPRLAEAFTLVLREDGVVMGTSDCNRFSGSYSSVDNKLVFGNFASTRMYCEGAQETDFLKQLGEVESYFINKEGRLVLQLKFDSGAMIFR